MQLTPKPQHYLQWLGATLAAVLTTVGLAMTHARATTAGMVFLVVVVVTASQSRTCDFALQCAAVRRRVRLLLSSTFAHSYPGWSAGVGFDADVSGELGCRGPGVGTGAKAERPGAAASRGRGTALPAEPGDDAERRCGGADPRLAGAWWQRSLRSEAWSCLCRNEISMSRPWRSCRSYLKPICAR